METNLERSSNVARFLPARAAADPDACALKIPRRTGGRLEYQRMTFSELDRAVDLRCRVLTEKGVRRGERVLLMVRPGLDLIVIVFALFKIGAVPVVIDPGMGLRSFLRCVARTRPEALIAIPMGIVVSRIFPRAFGSVGVRIGVGEVMEELNAPKEPFRTCICRPDDPAAILFTSGSTGAAKGVRYEHGMFAAQVEAIRTNYGIEPGEVDLPMLPVFALFNPALGMTTVVPEMNPSRPATVNPLHIVEAIQTCNVTNSFGSPVLWKRIGAYCLENGVKLPSLRRILMAGVPVPPDLIEAFGRILDGGEIHSPYGATEALPVSSISGREILEDTRAITEAGGGTCVGRPLSGIEVKVLEINDVPLAGFDEDRECAPGTVGEIVVSGQVVTREYDRLPEATSAAKFREGGKVWHRMGDAGYIDERGRLWFCGRVVERVRTREGTLYTDCCEAIFNRVFGVFRTALIGLGEPGSHTPALVVEPESGAFPKSRAQKDALVERLREAGGRHEMTAGIRTFFFEKKFPVDVRHNAKIHRLTLARRWLKRFRRKVGVVRQSD